MGSDDLFKKRRKERKAGNRKPKADSVLIITEGKRTEPLYFKGLKQKIEQSITNQTFYYPTLIRWKKVFVWIAYLMGSGSRSIQPLVKLYESYSNYI